MKKYLFLIIAALLLLFWFSNMSYEQQTIIPSLQQILSDEPMIDLLSKIEVTYWGKTISVETRGYYYFVEFLIRKGSHFIGFGLIGGLFYLLYRKLAFKYAAIYAVFSTFLIAALDEYHQTLIPGRTGVFDDVLLDTAGAVTFVSLIKMGLFFNKRIFNKRVNIH